MDDAIYLFLLQYSLSHLLWWLLFSVLPSHTHTHKPKKYENPLKKNEKNENYEEEINK